MNTAQKGYVVEKEVLGLDVAVDDLLGVEVVENEGCLEEPLEHLLAGKRRGTLLLYALVHVAFR